MIIISKKKDFYDYFVGIYGRDEKRVLDRRGWEKNKIYNLFPTSTEYLIDYEKENECEIRRFAILGTLYSVDYTINKKVSLTKPHKIGWGRKFINQKPTTINKDLRLPFLTLNPYDENNWTPILLVDYLLNKILDAETIYKDLDLFLGYLVDNPPIKNNQTNSEKVLSNGFDLKTSFRH